MLKWAMVVSVVFIGLSIYISSNVGPGLPVVPEQARPAPSARVAASPLFVGSSVVEPPQGRLTQAEQTLTNRVAPQRSLPTEGGAILPQ